MLRLVNAITLFLNASLALRDCDLKSLEYE